MKLPMVNSKRWIIVGPALFTGIFSLCGCGTQIGNPWDDKEPEKDERADSAKDHQHDTDPLAETTTTSAGLPMLPKCVATAALSTPEAEVTTGKATFVFTAEPGGAAQVLYTPPGGTEATGSEFDLATTGVYVVRALFADATSCYLTLTIDATNRKKNMRIQITSPRANFLPDQPQPEEEL